jgi:hypothetical protein
MSTVQDIQLTLGDTTDFTGGTLFAGDSRFNPCAMLKNDGESLTLNRGEVKPTNNATLSLWLKRSAGTKIQLGSDTDFLKIDTDGSLMLFKDSVIQGVSFRKIVNNDSTNVFATDEQWQHVAWVKKDNDDENGGIYTLYLNGIALQTQTLVNAPSPADVVKIVADGENAYFAHFHYYPRVLTVTEVLTDMYGQSNAYHSFIDQYPLDFALVQISTNGQVALSENKLRIEDVSGNERICQQLQITNVSDRPITLSKATGSASKDNYHLELRLRNGTFSEPETYPRFNNFESTLNKPKEPTDWSVTKAPTQNLDDGSWSVYLLSTSTTERALPAQGELSLPFEYTTADGALGARGTRVVLNYAKMRFNDGQIIEGVREKQVDIVNVSGIPFPLVASVSAQKGIVCNASNASLTFVLANNSVGTVSFTENAAFRIIIPLGDTNSDLAANGSAAGNAAAPLKKLSASESTSIFEWQPSGSIQPRQHQMLTITGITPNTNFGTAIVYIEYQGVKGCASGKLSVPITKISRDISELVGGGNVGIGTNEPSEKLEVAGTIKAQQIKIGDTIITTKQLEIFEKLDINSLQDVLHRLTSTKLLELLEKFADSKLTVAIASTSKNNSYLDHYHSRTHGGDRDRTIQFRKGLRPKNTTMRLEIDP